MPLTADPHVSTGSTPGVGVLKVTAGGRNGVSKPLAPVSNVDAGGVERADVHAMTIVLIGRATHRVCQNEPNVEPRTSTTVSAMIGPTTEHDEDVEVRLAVCQAADAEHRDHRAVVGQRVEAARGDRRDAVEQLGVDARRRALSGRSFRARSARCSSPPEAEPVIARHDVHRDRFRDQRVGARARAPRPGRAQRPPATRSPRRTRPPRPY